LKNDRAAINALHFVQQHPTKKPQLLTVKAAITVLHFLIKMKNNPDE